MIVSSRVREKSATEKPTRAVFLDRDGVINVDTGYPYRPDQFTFIEGVFDACRHLQSLGYLLIVVTNQSGIGRGYYSEDDLLHLNDWMVNQFQREGIEISAVYACPHTPSSSGEPRCECRKPAPGMILRALTEFHIDPTQSVMIGDRASDVEAGERAQIGKLILIDPSQETSTSTRTKALPARTEIWSGLREALNQLKH